MKKKHWQVSVFDKTIETIINDTFYTTDTEAYLVFELIDEDFTPDSAMVTVYNIYGKVIINVSVEVADGIARYEMPEKAIRHPGGWRTQAIFTKDDEDYTTKIIEFDVGGHLLDNKKPPIVEIENWNSLIEHAEELIDDWEQLEEIRQANEQQRELAESARQTTFETNETTRQSEFETNEAERESEFNINESARQANELIREEAEGNRQSEFEEKEAGRQSEFEENEQARESAESVRVSNEEERELNEAERILKDSERDSKIEAIEGLQSEFSAHKEDYVAEVGNINAQLADITNKINNKSKIYGVQFSGSNAAGARTHDAIGMVANVGVNDQLVQNDFDNVSFFRRPRCLVYHDSAGNAQVMAYEGEPGFNLEGAIFAPYTEKAQVFYEQKPFYWNGSLDWPQVSATPLEGFELAPMFKNPVDKVYLPSYWLGLDNGKACSLSGTHPEYNSINGSMATARLYNARAHLETMAVRISEYVLQLVEFATRDLQNVMTGAMSNRYNADDISILAEDGVNRIVMANASADQFVVGQTICIGTTKNGSNIATRVVITAIDVYDASNKAISFDGPPLNIPLGAFISTRAWRNGATDIVKASSGSPVSNSNGRYPCIWRGKVDPWAMAYSGISDVLIQRSGAGTVEDPYIYNAYQLKDPTLYNNGVIDSNWIKVDYNLSPSNGYVTQMGKDPKSPAVRMPTAVGGASTTYYASYYYYSRNAVSAVFVGGYWTDGRGCSPVFFLLSSAPSYSSVFRLARLFVSPS